MAETHSRGTTQADARERAKQGHLVKRVNETYSPEAVGSKKGSIL